MAGQLSIETTLLPSGNALFLVDRDWSIPGRRKPQSRLFEPQKYHVISTQTPPPAAKQDRKTRKTSVKLPVERTSRLSQHPSGVDIAKTPPEKKSTVQSHERCRRAIMTATMAAVPVSEESKGHQSESAEQERSGFSVASLESQHCSELEPNVRTFVKDAEFQSRSIPGMNIRLSSFMQYDIPQYIPQPNFLNYYVTAIARAMYPLDNLYEFNPLLSIWLPMILSDELWFYCILFVVSRHLKAAVGELTYGRACSYLADACYRRLRERLSRASAGASLTDMDCAAVACLLSLESNLGSPKISLQHARGLASLVKQRGGLGTIGPALRMKVCRSDIEAAIDHNTRPSLPIFIPPDELYGDSQWDEMTLPAGAQSFLDGRYLSRPVVLFARDFFRLAASVQRSIARRLRMNPLELDERVYKIQSGLVGIEGTPIDLAFRAAALLFLKCLTRPLANISHTSTGLVTAIETNLRLCEGLSSQMIVWLSMMALVGSDTSRAQRYRLHSRLILELNLYVKGNFLSWNKLKEQLCQVAWIDAVLDNLGKNVWSRSNEYSSY